MEDLQILLERFRKGAEVVTAACADLSIEELDHASVPGKWSVRQILCHLADSEMVGHDRFSRIVAEENPTLLFYDQDAWATRLDYFRRPAAQSLGTFLRIRGENHDLLQGLPEEDWDRIGTHNRQGVLTLRDLLLIYTEHAESHAGQIRAAREAFAASQAEGY